MSAHKEAITKLNQNNDNITHGEESQGVYKDHSEREFCTRKLGIQLTRRRKRCW